MHIPWPDIHNFYTVRKTLAQYPELCQGRFQASYKAKIKLHGSNAGIRIRTGGEVFPLSRGNVLTPTSDNAGFAKWVLENEQQWSALRDSVRDFVIYGEWCGKGIQKGVACSQLPERIFAVFAIAYLQEGDHDLEVEPEVLQHVVQGIPKTHVIPWVNHTYDLDWSSPAENFKDLMDGINSQVAEIESCDPWIHSEFGIKGIGEGLVFYPISHPGWKSFSDLAFKAKGEKHSVVAHTKPVQVDPTVVQGCKEFANLVVTPARLEQGARAVAGGELVFSTKTIGAFLQWMTADLLKETSVELEASGLDRTLAMKACSTKAREWYLQQIKQ